MRTPLFLSAYLEKVPTPILAGTANTTCKHEKQCRGHDAHDADGLQGS